MAEKIGIIGFGNMGSAIAERIKDKYQVYVFDKDKNKTSDLSGIVVVESNADLVNKVDVFILAIKPQDFDIVLQEVGSCAKDKLVVTISAGINTAYIEKVLGNVRVIRVMPNIGTKIGEAEICLCNGKSASETDFDFVRELFNHLGKVWKIEENMMDAATAICGSGPAYIYYDIETNKIDPLNIPEDKKYDYIRRLTQAAKKVGFDSREAKELAVNVSYTSINLIKKTNTSPEDLRKQVTSKGGTTEAALEVLRKGGSWEEAAEAAMRRAEELSKKE